MAKWIERDGNKNDKVIRAAYKGFEAYTRGYIAATKESDVGTEREGRNRLFEIMERKRQQVATGLGIPGEEQKQTNELRELQHCDDRKAEQEKASGRLPAGAHKGSGVAVVGENDVPTGT